MDVLDSGVWNKHLTLDSDVVCVYNGTFLDKVPLADSHGRRAKRDIVQFVPFRNFINAVVPDGPLSVQQRE